MDKKAVVRWSFVFLLAFVFVFLILSIFISSSALEVKGEYSLGENVAINLEGVSYDRVKVVGPSTDLLLRKGEGKILFRPDEAGDYKVIIYSGQEINEYPFKVVEEDFGFEGNEDPEEVYDLTRLKDERSNNARGVLGRTEFEERENYEGIRVNKLVRWEEKVNAELEEALDIKIPKKGKNISVYNIVNGSMEKIDFEIKQKPRISLMPLLSNNDLELIVEDVSGEVIVEYYTDSPKVSERNISRNEKEVVVSSPEGLHYENVTSYSAIEEITANKNLISIYWEEEDRYLDFDAFDLDGNGLIDHIEWVVPHLSSQTFRIIIITNAMHLDSSRNFLEDAYNFVNAKDGNYITIPSGDYLRVNFQKNLTSDKDITIYARGSGGRVEVYEKDSNIKIADFGTINIEGEYKIFLSDLVGQEDTFDLKVVGGDVDFDYIVDPVTASDPWWTEYGETTLAASQATNIDLTREVDTSKAFILLSRRTGAGQDEPSDSGAYAEWINGTRFRLVKNSAEAGAIYVWQVIEGQNIYVQNGTQTFTSAQTNFNIPISSVNTSRSVVFMTFSSCDGTNPNMNNEIFWTGELTTSTNLYIQRDDSGNCDGNVAYFVVEFNDGSSIQTGSLSTVDSGGTYAVLNEAVNVSNTWFYFSSSYDGTAAGLDDTGVIARHHNSTAFLLSRQATGGSARVRWYAISTPRAYIQNGTTDLTSSNNVDTGISNVVLNRSFVMSSFDNTGAGTTYANTMGTARITTSTNLNLQRGTTGNAEIMSWHVVQLPEAEYFSIDVVSPLNSTYSQSSIDFNLSMGVVGDSCFYSLDGATNVSMTRINSTFYGASSVSVSDGSHEAFFYCNSTYGVENSTNVLFSIDTTNPSVVIDSPANISYNTQNLDFNFSVNDNNLDSCWYTNNSGLDNYTLPGCTNISYISSQGSQTLSLYANDSLGNINNTESVSFFVDSIYPLIEYGLGTEEDSTNFSRNSIYVNVSVIEDNEANITFRLYDSSHILINISASSNKERFINWSGYPSGRYYYNVSVVDVLSQINSTVTRSITLDLDGPSIEILSPEDSKTYTSNTSLLFNFSVSDSFSEVDSCWWNIDYGTNSSITCGGSTTFNSSEGAHSIFVYANDSLGNIADSNSTFAIFTQGPAVNLLTPEDNTYFNYTGSYLLNYSAIGPLGISSCNLYGDWDGGWKLNQTQRLNWWNESWDYREKLNITAQSDVSDLYTVDIVLNTLGSSFLDNGDDIRVTFYNGTDFIELDRLLVRPNKSNTQVQFKLQRNISAGFSDIDYSFYYGNPNATSPPDNASEVWLFYDDFSDGNMNEWTYASGTYDINTTIQNPWTGLNSVLKMGFCGDSVLKPSETLFTPTQDLKIRALWLDNPGLECTGGSPDADGILGVRGGLNTNNDGILLEWDTDTGFHWDSGAVGNVAGDYVPFEEWIWTESVVYGIDPADHIAKHWNFTELEPSSYQLTATSVSVTGAGLPYLRTASGTALVAAVFASVNVENDPIVAVQEEEWLGEFNVTLDSDNEYNWNVVCYDRNGAGSFAVNNYTFTVDTVFPLIYHSPSNWSDDMPDSRTFSGSPGEYVNASDQDFGTYSLIDSDPDIDILYMNYTTPGISAIRGNLEYLVDWNIAAGGIDCFNYTSDNWVKFVDMADNTLTNASIPLGCFIGESILQTRAYRSLSTAFGDVNFYDSQVNWEVVPSDIDGANRSQSNVFSSVIVEEINDANITFDLYNSTSLVNSSVYLNARAINWTGLNDESYYYNITVIDYTGKSNTTSTRRITLDTNAPNATLVSPEDGVYVNSSSQNLTVNITDNIDIDNATLFIFNETDDLINETEVEVSGTEAVIGIVYTFLYDGIFKWMYSIFDIAGNTFSTDNQTLIIDTTGPLIDFGEGTDGDGSESERSFIYVNVSYEEKNIANITFTLVNTNTGLVENETTFSSSNNLLNWTGLDSGNVTYEFNVTLRDLAGNMNYTSTRSVKLYDSQAPLLTLITPQNQTYYASEGLPLNFSVSDDNLDSCWYNLNGGSNISISGCISTTFDTVDGSTTLNIFANDTAGLVNFSTVTFFANSSLVETPGWLVQRGSAFVDGTNNVNLGIPVDKDKSFALITSRSSDSDTISLQVMPDLVSSIQLELSNYVTGAGADVEWEVVTGPNLSVQRGTEAHTTALSVDVPIDEVNLSKAFIIVNSRLDAGTGSGASNDEAYWTGSFVNSTLLNFQRTVGTSSGEISWQVVEWEGASVQNGSLSSASTSANVVLDSSINMTNSFLIFSRRVDGGLDDTTVGGYIVNSTELSFYRVGAGGNMDVEWFVVESDLIISDRGQVLVSGSTGPFYQAIGRELINMSRTFNRPSWSSTGGGTTFANALITSEILNDTDLRFYKGTSNQNNDIAWQTIELIEKSSPNVQLIYPGNSSQVSVSVVPNFTYYVTDFSEVISCYLYGDWSGGWHLNQTVLDIPKGINNFSSVDLGGDGTYSWNVECEDIYGNIGFSEANYSFIVDSTFPIIEYGIGTEESAVNRSQNNVYVNVTAFDSNEANITFNLFNTTGLVNSTLFSYSERVMNFTGLSDGTYYYNVTVVDLFSNSNTTSTRRITLDTNAPNTTLLSPEDGVYVNSSSQNLTVNITDSLGIDNATLSVFNETEDLINQTTVPVSGTEAVVGIVYTFLYDGIFKWMYSVYDFAGNLFETQNNTVIIDTANPLIDFDIGTEQTETNLSRDNIYVKISLNEDNLANLTYTLSDGFSIVSEDTFTTSVLSINWTPLSEGLYYYNVSVIDLAGNFNYTGTRIIRIDSNSPNVNIENPLEGQLFGTNESLDLNFSVSDSFIGIDSCWYNIDDGPNITLPNCVNTTFNVSEGIHDLNLYSNDSLNNANYDSVSFSISLLGPVIVVNYPENNTYVGSPEVTIDIVPSDPDGIDVCSLYGDWAGGWHLNQTNSSVNSGNVTEFDINLSDGDGDYYWNVYCNDSFGFVGNLEGNYTLTFDPSYPLIEYGLGTEIDAANLSSGNIYVNVSVIEDNEANITFRLFNTTGLVNSTQYSNGFRYVNWTGLPDETYFYDVAVTDFVGRQNSTEFRSALVDSTFPLIEYGIGTENNGVNISRDHIYVNVSVVEDNQENITFGLYNSSGPVSVSVFHSNIRNVNFTGLSDGTYEYNVTVYDVIGRINYTSTRSITLDAQGPTAYLVSPLNNSYSNNFTQTFSANFSDSVGLHNATFSIYNETEDLINSTFVSVSGTFDQIGIIYDLPYEGEFYWNYNVFDLIGNSFFTENRTFTIDLQFPNIDFGERTENSGVNRSQSNIYVNVSYEDTNLGNITFFLYNSTDYVKEKTYPGEVPRSINLLNNSYGTFEDIVATSNNGGDFDVINLVDNNYIGSNTYSWASSSGTTSNVNVTINLTGSYEFDTVEVFEGFGTNYDASPRNTRVYVSDDYVNWELVATKQLFSGGPSREGQFDSLNFETQTKKYVKIEFIDNWGDLSFMGSNEIRLYQSTINLASLSTTSVLDDPFQYTSNIGINLTRNGILGESSGVYWQSNGSASVNVTWDFGDIEKIDSLDWFGTSFGTNYYPNNYRVYVSGDGLSYSEISSGSFSGGVSGYFERISWAEVSSRYLRLEVVDAYSASVRANEIRVWESESEIRSYHNFTGLSDGTYEYNVTLYDGAGNLNSTSTRFITLDTTASNATLLSPGNGTYTSSVDQNLTVNITDNLGIDNATLSVFNETEDLINQTTVPVSGTEAVVGIVYTFLYDGIFKWMYSVYDFAGNLFETQNNTVIIDTVYPLIEFGDGTEDDASNFTRDWIYVNVSIVEDNYANISFNLYNLTDEVNITQFSDSTRIINWTNLPYTNYSYNVSVIDLAGNVNTSITRTISLVIPDFVPPIVNITSPDNITYGFSTILFNVSLDEEGSYCNYTLDEGLNNYTMSSQDGFTYNGSRPGLSDGSQMVRFYCADIFDNVNSSATRYFSIDTTSPEIEIVYPQNVSYSLNISELNYSYSDVGFGSCWYSIDNGLTNTSSVLAGINFTGISSSEGSNEWAVYCNDSFGFENSSRVVFFKDTIYPLIDFSGGTEESGVNRSQNNLYVNVSIVEDNYANISFGIYNLSGVVNETVFNDSTRSINFTIISDGVYEYNVTVYDNVGNINYTLTREITLDVTGPNATLLLPNNETYISGTDVNLTVNITDNLGIDNATLSIFNSSDDLINSTTVPVSGTEAVVGIVYTFLYDGIFKWMYSVYDFAGNLFETQNNTVIIDTANPLIDFGEGTAVNGDNRSEDFIYINVSVNEINLANITYQIFNISGSVNETTYEAAIYNVNFTSLEEGLYFYNVSYVDLAGNVNVTSIRYIALDRTNPNATLLSPGNGTYQNNLTQNFTANITDNLGFANATLSVYNQTEDLINQTTVSVFDTEAVVGVIYTLPYEGEFYWNYLVRDAAGNFFISDNNTMRADITLPEIDFGDKTLGDLVNISRDHVYVNVSVVEDNYANITFGIYNLSGIINETTFNDGTRNINFTGLSDGTYEYNVTIYDYASNFNYTSTRRITLDVNAPNATLLSPGNGTYTSSVDQNLTVNITDNLGIDNATLSVFNETEDLINQTTVPVSGTEAVVGIVYTFLYDGIFKWMYSVYDFAGNLFETQNNTLIIDTTPAGINLLSPNTYSGDNDGDVSFIYNVSELNSVDNCTLIFNGLSNQTNSSINLTSTNNFILQDLVNGTYNWSVGCYDLVGNYNVSNVRYFDVILTTEFDGDTTDFSIVDTSNISSLVVEDTRYGRINYIDNLNFSGGVNLSYVVDIMDSSIIVESDLDNRLNRSANLILYNLSYLFTPVVLRNGEVCDNNVCSVNYYSGGNLSFNVSHFTNYSSAENSRLAVSDDTDEASKYEYNQVKFFANYTNRTLGESINGTGAYCNISFNVTGTWDPWVSAEFNSSSMLYEYNRTFSSGGLYEWRYYCNGSSLGYEPLTAYDEANITSDVVIPLIEYGIGTENNGVNISRDHIYVNVSVVEDNEANITFGIYNLSGIINETTFNDGTRNINFTGLSDGTYEYNVTIYDYASNFNYTSTRRITLDVNAPNATLLSPGNGTYTSSVDQNLTVNITDNLGIDNATLSVFNETEDLINSTTVPVSGTEAVVGIVYTFLYDGIFKWMYSVYDFAGNIFFSTNNTITIDTNGPVVSLDYPSDGLVVSTPDIGFEGSFNDVYTLGSSGFYLWNSTGNLINQTNFSISGLVNSSNLSVTLPYFDNYSWNYYACDELGNCNWNSGNYSLIYEAREVGIDIIYPLGDVMVAQNHFFNVTVNVSCLSGQCGVANVSLDPVEWWDSSWAYRKVLHINSSSDGALTNYQKKVVVNYGSGTDSGLTMYVNYSSQPDFDDIRFVNESGDELDHYLIQKSDSSQAAFYVEIPVIPAIGGTSIYVYYNNSGASSASNGTNTFYEFESWDNVASSSIDTAGGGGGISFISMSSGYKEGSDGARNNDGGQGYKTEMQNDNQYDIDDYITEGWLYIGPSATGNDNFGPGIHVAGTLGSLNGYQAIIDERSAQSPQIREDTANTGRTNGIYAVADQTWYLINIYRQGGSNVLSELWTEAQVYGSSPQTTTTRASETTHNSGYTGVFAYSTANSYFDAMWTRARTENEPVYDNWSQQEEFASVKTGLVSTVVGDTPFYTNDSNPRISSFLDKGESQIIVFTVNATGTGIHEFFAFANLTSNLSVSNSSFKWNVTIDTFAPEINVLSPQNISYYVSTIDFNITSNEPLSSCKFTLNNWATNYTMIELNTTSFGYINSSVSDGNYLAKFWCSDLAENINSTEVVNFTVDVYGPNATLLNPGNGTYRNSSNQNFTVNVSDLVELNNATLSIFNSSDDLINSTTVPVSGTEAVVGIVYTFLYDGIFKWMYSVYDFAGNLFETQNNTVIIDTTNPGIVFGDGTAVNGDNRSENFIYINVTVDEVNLANITYDLYNNSFGIPLVNRTSYQNSIFQINFTGLNDGIYYYNVTYRDLAGNRNATETRNIRLDTQAPIVNTIFPDAIPYGYNITYLNFSVSDPLLDTCWYNINQTTNQTVNCGSEINVNLSDGSYTWYMYANDTLGHIGSDEVSFIVNTALPEVIIDYPINVTYPYVVNGINFSATDTDLDTCWYNLDGGPNITTSCTSNITGLSANQGSNVWYVYANDSANGLSFDFVSFSVDTLAPELTIVSPLNDSYYPSSVSFNVSSNEIMDFCSMSIDNWAVNYTMSNSSNSYFYYTNTSMPEGIYTAKFWCNDSYGNYNSTESVEFSVSYPLINISLVYPTQEINVTRSTFFNISFNVSCDIVDCGEINVTLDPPLDEYTILNFTEMALTNWTVPVGVTEIEVLIVAGGGSGGRNVDYVSTATGAGGGGAGGLIHNSSYGVIPGEVINISVGEGGVFPASPGQGNDGEDSWISGSSGLLTAIGGGGGGYRDASLGVGRPGGSGGGGGYQTVGGSGTASQGNDGGDGTLDYGGSGGGGAGSAGEDGNTDIGRSGGVGLNMSDYFGTEYGENGWFAGGGAGGSRDDNIVGIGGTGGGGNGANNTLLGTHGLNGTGAGGGGSGDQQGLVGGSGGSGIVLIKYLSVVDKGIVNTAYGANPFFTEVNPMTISLNRTQSVIVNFWVNVTGTPNTYEFFAFTNLTRDPFVQNDSERVNVTIISPIITLLYPDGENFTGYTTSEFNFSVNEGYYSSCALWGNWSGSFVEEQIRYSISTGVELNFSSETTSGDGFYGWRVRCNDSFGGLTWSEDTYSFSTFLPPNSPILLNASQDSNDGTGNVTLFWSSAGHATAYSVYYNESLEGNFVYMGQTNGLNFTDTNFSGSKRRFYRIDATNPIGQNDSEDYFGAHVYNLEHNGNTRNWIGLPSNASYLTLAQEALNEIINSTAFTYWNETYQGRVTCNEFSCPSFLSCTSTNCNFNLDSGRGYEVNVNSTSASEYNWSLVGIVFNIENISLISNSTDFSKNWFSVYPYSNLSYASDVLGNVSQADAVSRWNPSSQTSVGLIPSPFPFIPFLGTNFELNMEEGYEVSVVNNVNWTQK